jgi:ribonucleoside-diphosphate reductase alpha chain
MKNSLLISPMPTASTAQILGNNESVEPYTYIISSRKVLSGEFIVINKYLIKILKELKLWNKELADKIITSKGSIQGIEEIPQNIKDIYRTVWELSQKILIDLTADRSPYIDQAQSLNIFISRPTIAKLSTLHMYTYEKKLKTGMYYLRTQSARDAIQFTIMKKISELDKKIPKESDKIDDSSKIVTRKGKKFICTEYECIMCSG